MPERLTDRAIRKLKPSPDGSIFHFDSEVVGLAVRVYKSGRKSFTFDWRENGKQRRVTLGGFPAWSIGKARQHAGTMRLKADTGESVAPGRGGRIAELIAEWRDQVVAVTRRSRTLKSYTRLIACHILPSFGTCDPRTLTRDDIVRWHGGLAQRIPIDANRALATLSSFLTWLEQANKIERNMANGVKYAPENERHVFLTAEQIVAAHAALDRDANRPAALALKLSLLTGCRIGEAIGLVQEQLDVAHRAWIKTTATKGKRVHVVPLQPEAVATAVELLRLGPTNYEACRQAWYRARAIIGRVDVRIHDLRHTRASALARNGASLPMIGRVLGHSSPAHTSRYMHLVDSDLRDLVERS